MAAADIKIYLRSTDGENTWFPALQIPRSDVQRLSLFPLKWLRFVAFTVCGARGDLSEIQNGPVVDYENTVNLGNVYYYITTEELHFVDCNLFKDQVTTSSDFEYYPDFHDDIVARDGACVISQEDAEVVCDATYIIPGDKGDEYITFVINDRRHLYQEQQFPPKATTQFSANMVENGLLLRADLHRWFGCGGLAFLRTPNFAMQCEDVHRVETSPMPDMRITMQYIKPTTGCAPVPQYDVQMTGTREPPPSSLLLDFMYGVAVVKSWPTEELQKVLKKHLEDYEEIPSLPESVQGRKHRPVVSDEMLQSMDYVLTLSMQVNRHTLQQITAERERQEKEAEACAQEAAQTKILGWQQVPGVASVLQ